MTLPRSADSTRADAKPKVLLVDDHPEILKSVSRLLADDFDVVAAATDGYEALDAAQRLDPDIVVLDIMMPGLDGFRTAEELRRSGSRAPIVFLSMHAGEEYVVEGFRSGGRGYVLKARLYPDLANAMDRALAGQLFVPSLTSLLVINDGRTGHAAQFYGDDRVLVDEVGAFFNTALQRGDTVLLIGAEPVRAGLAKRLQAYGWSVGESGEHGRYQAIDTADAISSIVQGGRLDTDRVAQFAADLERTRVAKAEGPHPRMTIVGGIAGQLIQSGNPIAAMDMEREWDKLTRGLPFLTVCTYPMSSFAGAADADLFPHMCAEHQAVAHNPDRARRSRPV